MSQFPLLAISHLQEHYASGDLQPEDVVEQIYARIEQQDLRPVWIELEPKEQLRARARALAAQKERGPLYGIPFAVKDNIDVAGLPTTAGCPAFAYRPESTAFAVQQLLDAGAILIGKTNLDQFATGLVGTRSPYGACSSVFNSDYISGGSSAGSAVAVAQGLVSFALGTDTAGSGRVPAAFNNIVGLKPSRGVISASGVVPACRSLDCVSVFALTSLDAAKVLRVAAKFDAADPFGRERPVPSPHNGVTVCGIPKPDQLEFFGDATYQSLFQETVNAVRSLGVEAVEIDFTPFREAAQLLYGGPWVAERFAAVGAFTKAHAEDVHPIVGSIINHAETYSAVDAFRAQYQLTALAREASRAWKQVDALLLPTAPTTYTIQEVLAEPISFNTRLGYYTNFVNLLDLAAVALPGGFRPDGLPFGITLVGPAFTDERLLHFADRLHRTRTTFVGAHLAELAELSALPPSGHADGWAEIGVVGAHLSGEPLNYQLLERGARLVRTTRTSIDYRFYALTNTVPAKPGLIRETGFMGPGIEVEVWTMPVTNLGSFVAAIPPPLGIGTWQLIDGSSVKGFLCEPFAIANMPEITAFGGWRKYLQSLRKH